MKIYLIGSLRNKEIPIVAQRLRGYNLDVFDQWYSAGPNADDHLRDHFSAMGMNHAEILQTAAAKNIFEFDKRHILDSDAAVLLMPAGKSGFLELGWAIGKGKPGYILYDNDPERIDVMFQFATSIFYSVEELAKSLQQTSQAISSGGGVCGEADQIRESIHSRSRRDEGTSLRKVSYMDSEQLSFDWGV